MDSAFDPALAELIWSVIMTSGLLGLGMIALSVLPWTETEINATSQELNTFSEPAVRRVHT